MGTFTLSNGRLAQFAVGASLMLATLGCQLNLGGPQAPEAPPPDSNSTFQEFEGLFEGAAITGDGHFTVIVTEAQMTSLVAARFQLEEDPFLKDPVILLQDGAIQLHGKVEEGLLTADALVVIEPVIQGDGSLAFSVTSADLGPIPVPDPLRDSLSTMITEAFTGSIGPLATGIRLDTVAIDNGEMAIQGQIR